MKEMIGTTSRCAPHTFARFLTAPENAAALVAVQRLAESLHAELPTASPLFLHGPPGTGKTHLVQALVDQVVTTLPDRSIQVLSAGDFRVTSEGHAADLTACDLLVVEDVHFLPVTAAEGFVQVLDTLHDQSASVLLTANQGPGHFQHLPTRLTSRWAAGLVVELRPLSSASRLALLESGARRRRLDLSAELIAWVANQLPGGAGGRQVDGALLTLETLSRNRSRPLGIADVAEHFQTSTEDSRPSVEQIIERIARQYRIEPKVLRSARRSTEVLLPRQLAMYLARELTGLSLARIGDSFGGRDHSTVLHACRKVEAALTEDAVLSGIVRQVLAELS